LPLRVAQLALAQVQCRLGTKPEPHQSAAICSTACSNPLDMSAD
jgi:hypothetical protein